MMLLKAILFDLDFLTIYAYMYIYIYVGSMIVRYLVNLLQLGKIILLLIFRKFFYHVSQILWQNMLHFYMADSTQLIGI